MKRRTILRTMALAASLVALTIACAPAGRNASPTPTPAPWGVAGFDTREVNLGTAPRDQDGVQTFLVFNRGRGPLRVGPATVRVEEGCDAASVPAVDVTVDPMEVVFLPVELGAHRRAGPHVIRVDVPTSDPAAPLTTLTVRFVVDEQTPAPGSGPRLQVEKRSVDTGVIPYDWPGYQQFTLRNAGDADLILEGKPALRVLQGC
jgi:hypothetical protein